MNEAICSNFYDPDRKLRLGKATGMVPGYNGAPYLDGLLNLI